jgi:tyrosine decarboxylase/aspartate 1-decarboxylase
MRNSGLPEKDLFSFLAAQKEKDLGYRDVLSSMCTIPHPVAVKANLMFIEANLGDPGLFSGCSELERLLIERIGALFHHREAGGYATSGGTESNIQALRIAKKRRRAKNPNIVVPESAHFSFEKASDILSLELRTVPCDVEYRMDSSYLEEQIDKNTVCIIGIAGSTEYGMVDPIAHLADVAEDRDIHLHVDAAFGGLVLPFLKYKIPFDFSLPGVDTISVDPHKMGLATIPVGCLLVRDPAVMKCLSVETPYLTVKEGFTLLGTRSGGAVAGALAVLEYLGQDGMEAMVRGCMKNTERLIAGMETWGCRAVVRPDVNVATFFCEDVPSRWHVSHTRQGHLRIVCMPHVHAGVIEQFLRDIGEIYAEESC